MRPPTLVALALAGCTAPAPIFDTVKVGFGPSLDASPVDWRPDQLTALRSQLGDASQLGIRFVETDEGAADVVVRQFDSGAGCASGSGRYHPGSDYVEVDPACTPGYDALRRAVAHELVHFWTYSRYQSVWHICAGRADRPDCSQVATCEDCLMSPGLARPGEGPTADEQWDGDYVDPDPQPADYAFVAHCRAAGRCE